MYRQKKTYSDWTQDDQHIPSFQPQHNQPNQPNQPTTNLSTIRQKTSMTNPSNISNPGIPIYKYQSLLQRNAQLIEEIVILQQKVSWYQLAYKQVKYQQLYKSLNNIPKVSKTTQTVTQSNIVDEMNE